MSEDHIIVLQTNEGKDLQMKMVASEQCAKNNEIINRRIKDAIRELIDYVDYRFKDPSHRESSWAFIDGKRQNLDVGYAEEWWESCMKPELEKRYLSDD